MTPRAARRAAGFTLVEAVLVIVIVGIIGAIVAVFIRGPVVAYADSAARAAVTDEADLALRRIARDLRLALPNSVRVNGTGDSVEFLLTTTGGRYLAREDFVPGRPVLDFDDPTQTSFTVVGGTMRPINVGDFIVVYNLGPDMAPADAYLARDGAPERNIARVTAINLQDPNNPVVQLAYNPFATQQTPMSSPDRRFQVVDGPVTYRCEQQGADNVLARYWGYTINAQQLSPPQGTPRRAVIATGIPTCAGLFRYGAAPTRRSGLVLINLQLRVDTADRPVIRLVHQVHVDNTP